VQKSLASNAQAVEATETNALSAFDSGGWTMGAHGAWNESGKTYVAWNWNCPTTFSGNTDGTITSSGRKNTDAGFSIVSWNGTSANATVGHGLSKAPEMVIVKRRDGGSGYPWGIYHSGTASDAETDTLRFDTTAINDHPNWWNDTAPTATTFSVGVSVNHNSGSMITYCFHSVEGYSKVGSYTGNGSSDGPFIYTGFRPKYIMIKISNASSNRDWYIFDSERDSYNEVSRRLMPNLSNAEGTGSVCDFVSNGFKWRTSNDEYNANGLTTIYLAFAEYPFKYTNAR